MQISFAAVPLIYINRGIIKIRHVFPTKSPLEALWNSEVKWTVYRSIRQGHGGYSAIGIWAVGCQGWGYQQVWRHGLDVYPTEVEETVPKPSKPILAMNMNDIDIFCIEFMMYLCNREKIEREKLWATKTKKGFVAAEPTL